MGALRHEPRPAQCDHLGQKLYRIGAGERGIVYALSDQEKAPSVGKAAGVRNSFAATWRCCSLKLTRPESAACEPAGNASCQTVSSLQ